jgi:hypothetical protein
MQKIQRIHQQQLRIAELHLARLMAGVKAVEDKIEQLLQNCLNLEQYITNELNNQQRLQATTIQAARSRVEHCRTDIQAQAKYRIRLVDETVQRQTEYRELKARSDGIEQLLVKKQTEHRRQAMLHEQTELEESARAIRMLSSGGEIRQVDEDGVIQG